MPENSPAEREAVRELWLEYWKSLGLPEDFSGVYPLLLIEQFEGNPSGTVSLRHLSEKACEMKRLYVRPAYRGLGLGRKLVERAIAGARELGYSRLYADTLPEMTTALAMYRRLGFRDSQPYSTKPTPCAIFLHLSL